MAYLLDTTFLIDLERENFSIKGTRKANSFLESNRDGLFSISIITLGEFSAGLKGKEKEKFQSFFSGILIIPIDQEIAWLYGQLFQELRAKGKTLGSNDLWIAATALRHGYKVVTANAKDFSRISGLDVVHY